MLTLALITLVSIGLCLAGCLWMTWKYGRRSRKSSFVNENCTRKWGETVVTPAEAAHFLERYSKGMTIGLSQIYRKCFENQLDYNFDQQKFFKHVDRSQ